MTGALVLSEKVHYAEALARSNLLPAAYRGNPANVIVAIEYGESLGFSPLQAMNLVHVIDGKPSLSAQAIGGLVRRAGHKLRVTYDTATRTAVAEVVRSDDPEFTFRSEWSWARAEAARLTGKNNWRTYPDAMLKARAITEVARDACPEALFGAAYTPDELGAETDGDGTPTARVEATYTPPVDDRSVHDRFVEACRQNDIDPADVLELLGAAEVTTENMVDARNIFKGLVQARAEDAAAGVADGGVVQVDEGPVAVADDPGSEDASPLVTGQSGLADDKLTTPLSNAERAELMALCATVFGKDRTARMVWAEEVTGRVLESFNQLTSWEAQHMSRMLAEKAGGGA